VGEDYLEQAGWAADFGQEDDDSAPGHILDINPCELCKPDFPISYYGHRECFIDCCQGQLKDERERFEDDLVIGHIPMVLNGFNITMPTPVFTDYLQMRARPR
jgi:hypothetical protein